MEIIIRIDEIFVGTLTQWQDTFYAFPSLSLGAQLESIISFCASNEWEVQFECSLEKDTV